MCQCANVISNLSVSSICYTYFRTKNYKKRILSSITLIYKTQNQFIKYLNINNLHNSKNFSPTHCQIKNFSYFCIAILQGSLAQLV